MAITKFVKNGEAMHKQNLVRVFVKGGILSPGEFLNILEVANKLGTNYVHFGSRQDILFPIKSNNKELLDKIFESINTTYEIDEFIHHNIVSSYVALDVMPNKKWLVPHVYHYILDSFNYKTKYRINLVDPTQSLVPLFTGNINFIASATDNYWYLYVRFNQLGNLPIVYPKLIFGYDLAKIAKCINEINLEDSNTTIEELFNNLDKIDANTLNPLEELKLPEALFPYYEGLNREAAGNYWLGIYWRNNEFTISFLMELCKRCIQTNVGKISLTPWKSFIVKGIGENHLMGWEKLMGKFGINLRHSSLELNWHLPVLSEESLELKNYLIKILGEKDINTSGLTFTIKPNDDIYLFTSVVIEINKNKNDAVKTYNILYSKNFNPNSGNYTSYVSKVSKEVLPVLLIELSIMYFDQLENEPSLPNKATNPLPKQETAKYQCKNCLTIYDEKYGDSLVGIASGVKFDELPATYKCSTCDGEKIDFVII